MNNNANRKHIIIGGILIGMLILAAVIVLIVLNNHGLGNSFFVSDGTKYVLNVAADEISLQDESLRPVQAYNVYYYSGDDVTGVEIYYEYRTPAQATSAYEVYKSSNSEYQ